MSDQRPQLQLAQVVAVLAVGLVVARIIADYLYDPVVEAERIVDEAGDDAT